MEAVEAADNSVAKIGASSSNIGDAVEAEVNLQKLLKKRVDEGKITMKDLKDQLDLNEIDGKHDGDSDADTNADARTITEEGDKKKKKKEKKNGWMYGPSHLQRFVDELNRSDPGRKGKVRIQRANRRAMQLLERVEPWPDDDKVA